MVNKLIYLHDQFNSNTTNIDMIWAIEYNLNLSMVFIFTKITIYESVFQDNLINHRMTMSLEIAMLS